MATSIFRSYKKTKADFEKKFKPLTTVYDMIVNDPVYSAEKFADLVDGRHEDSNAFVMLLNKEDGGLFW